MVRHAFKYNTKNVSKIKMIPKPIYELVPIISAIYDAGLKEKAFDLFLRSVIKFAKKNKKFKLDQYTPWQIEDMKLTLSHPEVLLLRTRRGGKTRDMTLIATFYSIVGKYVIWLAQSSDQLEQARRWFKLNPFVEAAKQYSIKFVKVKDEMPFGMLTKSRTASKGVDVIVYDEMAKVSKQDDQYDYYLYSRGQLAEGRDHKIISGTTPCLGSVEYEQFLQLKEIDEGAISIHDWHDCPWIDPDFIELEKQKHYNDKWYIQQEYECIHVARGGSLLSNIEEADLSNFKKKWNRIGVDYGAKSMFVCVYIDEEEHNCWVLKEYEYDLLRDDDLQKAGKLISDKEVGVMVEDGGFNYFIARWTARNLNNVRRTFWKKEDKSNALGKARRFEHIYVDPKLTPNTYNDLIYAIYKETEPIWVKNEKFPSHWLDAFMFSILATPTRILMPRQEYQNMNYDNDYRYSIFKRMQYDNLD